MKVDDPLSPCGSMGTPVVAGADRHERESYLGALFRRWLALFMSDICQRMFSP